MARFDEVRKPRTALLIMRLAAFHDAAGKKTAPITVKLTRSSCMRLGFKPVERGGPLTVGEHPLIYTGLTP